ncbi:MAG: hypothetical protein IK990_18360 [Ruminiclostridium sp.]|nr:hypothetical protein [Ruminiclostridium sp.]
MNKSVYSLVLSDEVVEAVDRAAHRAGVSRSAYINNVLAEAVSYTTPEKRMNDIFAEIEQLMNGDIFRIMPRPSETALAMRSALHYKYNPVINYSIELYRSFDTTLGKLKVSLRTQSKSLIGSFSDFLRLLAGTEREFISDRITGSVSYTFENGRFVRTFYRPAGENEPSNDEIANALSGYVQLFDELVKIYFANTQDRDAAEALIRQRYGAYIKAAGIII